MEIIDSICIEYHGHQTSINLAVGDLANLPPKHAVDAIIVSWQLPTYMRMTQYHDAREGDPDKIAKTATELLGQM